MVYQGHVFAPKVYQYDGWTFEFHSYMGPWPLKKNGDPRERAGRKFYKMFKEFDKLTCEEKEDLRIGGGSFFF